MNKNKICFYDADDIEIVLGKGKHAFPVSKYYLSRIFKKEMGVSLSQYYQQQKLRLVKKKVLSTSSEAYMAMELSFSDESHLCNAFKKIMGISLNEYKRSIEKLI